MNSQQAINLLNGLEQRLDDYCELNNEGKAAFRMAITALELFGNAEQLPSAQPEIIRCKDCKWWDRKGEQSSYGYCHAIKHSYFSPHWEISIYRTYDKDFFCADAERRNDE